ncbi:hypothetical protein D9V41_08355 [Aeromicrobium phragmitis]|uniref:DUF559 domain-containing protein n=1 Tax=Aeromicrobium phragmitis TaxID=2478914 RepID=A0A3L8PN33_9ACTN|nr:hypothetical protein [Aeromicrobium phragmitis]RLV55908.1 hypothetical protein D9V41_08355 [Aeromicrobium phragmitis]
MENPYFATRRTRDVLASGVSRGVAQGPTWQRRGHGLLVPSGTQDDPVTARLADAAALLTPGCAIGGWASLRLQQNTFFDGGTPIRPALIHCPPGAQLRRRACIQPFRGLTYPDEIIDLGGVAVTTMARAVFDELRLAPTLREAVVALDMGISSVTGTPRTHLAAVRRVVETHHKVRGLARARDALELACSRSASPWESRTRLVAQLDLGMRQLLVNAPVFSPSGELLAIVDLHDLDSGLMIEVDGDHHRERDQHAEDNRREERLERAGAVVSRVSSLDHQQPRELIARLAAARADASRSARRDWTLDKPPWWWSWPPGRRYD